jgi:4-hydroxybenzoate polyprenyltransferase
MIHFLTGSVIACGGAHLFGAYGVLTAALVWAVGLNGGTLAINSAFDRDEGDVGYLNNPPPVTKMLLPFSLVFLLGGQALAFFFDYRYALGYFICLVMSVLYSVPPFRWKRLAGIDLLINCFGYGFWTLLAGALVTGVRLDLHLLAIAGGFFWLFAALYPLTQLYQVEEDQKRGDLTLAIWIGPRRSLLFALVCAVLAHLFFVAGLVLNHRPELEFVLFPSLFCWVFLLILWYTGWEKYPHQKGMYRALVCWALTNITIVALYWHQV